MSSQKKKKKKNIICNAAIGNIWSYVAIVAWDWRGTLVFALSKKVETAIILVQAEVEAINWATLQVVSHSIESAIVESDAKICVDAH